MDANHQRRFESNRQNQYYDRSGKQNQAVHHPDMNYDHDNANKFEDAPANKGQEPYYYKNKKTWTAQQMKRDRSEKYNHPGQYEPSNAKDFGYYEQDYDYQEQGNYKYGHQERQDYE